MPDSYGPLAAGLENESAVEPALAPQPELAPDEAGADLDVGLDLGLAGSGFPAATRAGQIPLASPGLHARAIGRVQRLQGNFAAQRMLKRPPVQRVVPFPGNKPVADHKGVTPPGLLALKSDEAVWAKFKEAHTKDGKAGVNVFVHNTNIELSTCAPEDRDAIQAIFKAQQDRIDFSAHVPLPDKLADPAAYAEALRTHNGHIEAQVGELVAAGPKPLPNAPASILPPKPAQPRRRGSGSLPAGHSAADDDDWLAERIEDASGDGQPLEPHAQARLEAGLHSNLADVRVHTDEEAGLLANEMDALAFTSGRDIFFGPGTYQPGTSQGLELLAHEAAHTVQQASGPVDGTLAAGGVRVSDPSDPFEQAAEKMAEAVASAPPSGQGPSRLLDTAEGDSQAVQRAGLPPEEEQPKKPAPEPVPPEVAKLKQPEDLV